MRKSTSGGLPAVLLLALAMSPTATADDASMQALRIARDHARAIVKKHYDGGKQIEQKIQQYGRSSDGKSWMIKLELRWQGVLSDTIYSARGWLETSSKGWKWDEKWISTTVRDYRIKMALTKGVIKAFENSSKNRRRTPPKPARSLVSRSPVKLLGPPQKHWLGWDTRASHKAGNDFIQYWIGSFSIQDGGLPGVHAVKAQLSKITYHQKTMRTDNYRDRLPPGRGIVIKAYSNKHKHYGAVVMYRVRGGATYSCDSSSTQWAVLGGKSRTTRWTTLGSITVWHSKQPGQVEWKCQLPKPPPTRIALNRLSFQSWAVPPLVSSPSSWHMPLMADLDTVWRHLNAALKKNKLAKAKIEITYGRRLTCYPNGTLYALRATRGQQKGTYFLVIAGNHHLLLTGAATPIHAFNRKANLRLRTTQQVAEYMQIFCGGLAGKAGVFRIVNDLDDVRWLGTVAPVTRGSVRNMIKPMKITRNPKGGWSIETTMHYSNDLIKATLTLKSDGTVDMITDRVVIKNAPLRAERIPRSRAPSGLEGRPPTRSHVANPAEPWRHDPEPSRG